MQIASNTFNLHIPDAVRTALLRLLPFSLTERQRIGASTAIDEIIYSGFYPRILDQRLEPRQALGDYFETYIERDVRRLGGVRNLSSFRRFVRLCAGRVGQLLNLSSLGSDAGVSHTTAREWLTLLETSYIALLQPSFHANIGKRLSSISYVKVAQRESNSSVLFERRNRESTKELHIVADGFRLTSERAIEFRHHYNFTGYTGRANREFDVVLAVIWRLGGVECWRGVVIDGTPIPQLDTTIRYPALDTRTPDIDHVVAEVMKGLMHRIAALSIG